MPIANELSNDERAIANLLMQGVLRGDLDIYGWHEDCWPSDDAYMRIEMLAEIEIQSLVEVMRKTGLPLIQDWRWAAWDPEDGLVRTSVCSGPHNWLRMKLATQQIRIIEEPVDQFTVEFMLRALISIDHGHKPMLVCHEELPRALRGESFKFELPRYFCPAELSGMSLVYFTSRGEIKSVPAADAVRRIHGWLPLSTRNALYVQGDHGGLRPLPNNARFIADAFTIALRHNPNNFYYYKLRNEGTIYQPGIQRFNGPMNSFVAVDNNGARDVARQLMEWSISQGVVWLSVCSGHPLEANLVTTPRNYEFAVNKIEQFTHKKLTYTITGDVFLDDFIGDISIPL